MNRRKMCESPEVEVKFFEVKSRLQHVPDQTRVLVVDDEAPVRSLVDRVLRDAGYRTAVAADGRQTLEITSDGTPFDLLLTDLMMPGMPGDELARRLRQSIPGLKVLYLTGYSDHLFKARMTLQEGEAFLDKPFTVKGLLEAVAVLLYGHLLPPKL